jgi:hypothetical protein
MNVGRNQIPERKSIDGVKMKKILSLSLDKNEIDRITSVMEMKLYHNWELNETGGLDLYIEDWFSSQEEVFSR